MIKRVNGNKKISLLLTLRALEIAGISKKPYTQSGLAKLVDKFGEILKLNICCDRKTIGRNLKLLRAVGYDIVNVKGKGYYIDTMIFSKQEVEVLRKLIGSSSLYEGVKARLIEKISKRQSILDIGKLKEYFACDNKMEEK